MDTTLRDIRTLFERGAFRNEEHIRVCVVCRILHELGWNIWNPEEVHLEFACAPDEDHTKVDLALHSLPRRPDVFIEVKGSGQLRTRLTEIERQLRDYNRNNTAMFSIITDGAEWRFYYSQTGGEFSQKCFKVQNILRESIEDVGLTFKTLLQKAEIQNGNAEQKAVAYLRLTQKQRLMEEFLPEARRKALGPPFPPLPNALVELVAEQGIPITPEEASAFISEFQDRRSSVTIAPDISPKIEPRPPARPSTPGSAVRQLDSRNPGDLRFTRMSEGRIGIEQATGWGDLVRAGLRIAQAKGISFQELERKLSINLKNVPFAADGYRWHPELQLSIQGFDAKKAADNLFRLARLTSEELYIRLYWRDVEGAAHRGEEAVIHWRP
jgi:hypothetical protein